jgi:magnesium-transporting ATPase (P-type)
MENQTTKSKIRLFQICLWISLAIIVALILSLKLTSLFPGSHPPGDTYDLNYNWFSKIQLALIFVIVPALYGTFAWIPIRNLKRGKVVKSRFFIGIIPIGVINALIMAALAGFTHIDCGNDCGPDVPSHTLILTSFLVALLLTFVLPVLAMVKLEKLNGNPHATAQVLKKTILVIVILVAIVGSLIGWSDYRNAHQIDCNGTYKWFKC